MRSKKPYLIRAYYDWIVDNELTPHLLVNAEYPGIDIPEQYASDGRIVLNISPQACRGLHLENDRIVFTTKFAGNATQVFITPAAVLAIYANENSEGIHFPEEAEGDLPPIPGGSPKSTSSKKPSLKLVE